MTSNMYLLASSWRLVLYWLGREGLLSLFPWPLRFPGVKLGPSSFLTVGAVVARLVWRRPWSFIRRGNFCPNFVLVTNIFQMLLEIFSKEKISKWQLGRAKCKNFFTDVRLWEQRRCILISYDAWVRRDMASKPNFFILWHSCSVSDFASISWSTIWTSGDMPLVSACCSL